MSLTNTYLVGSGRVREFFEKIKSGQAPEQFTTQLLKDWGFGSSNDRAFIPLLKALGFLSPDGKPTSRYHTYRDHSRSEKVMAEALREAYSDIFLIKEIPSNSDKSSILGKFKSYHNTNDNVAGLMTKTFLALCELADFKGGNVTKNEVSSEPSANVLDRMVAPTGHVSHRPPPGLHYNIQIHLPATKDVEVYNAIFKSLREHLYDH
ncbi:DUF5343 domain-containing protein [Agrobacterium tumefaciens]|uniref:DUF5343 domain-containing protein n=1 Tax=Agrobacterium tumefaciens TaxID=358 RepID=UPI001ADC19BE|nr:DUF5343 domain-containing protein [Agrobacterium tumefaciens]